MFVDSRQTQVNFGTECFYLTAWALHLGPMAILRKHRRRQRVITEIEKAVKQIEEALKHAIDSKYPKG